METEMKTISLCVDKTVAYVQEIEVTDAEYERLESLNQQEQRKQLIAMFDEELADVSSVDVALDCYDFE
jgi:hypothetical protein